MSELLNPWGLTPLEWVVGFAGIRGAIAMYDHLVIFLVKLSGQKLLPTRTTGTPVRYVGLDTASIAFLTANALQEWVFVQQLCHYIWHSPAVPHALGDLGVLNTVAALAVMFLVLDLFYAPAHYVMHLPRFYALVHKHHHRQHFPVRGYLDAGNEHPVEHLIGTSCTWIAVLSAVHTTGAHAATIFLFFNAHAALAMLNHSPYDVKVGLLGFSYSVRAHEMHHRKFTANYAQYFMLFDRLASTFIEYDDGAPPRGAKKMD